MLLMTILHMKTHTQKTTRKGTHNRVDALINEWMSGTPTDTLATSRAARSIIPIAACIEACTTIPSASIAANAGCDTTEVGGRRIVTIAL